MSRLILFNKPYGVLCQFRRTDDKPTLADFFMTPPFILVADSIMTLKVYYY
jgi:16S rRNA U516 pseudouridylate synthase RsuA-like enzyme